MTADDWPRVKEIFQEALELPRDAREAYLTTVETSPEIRREVESLLAAAEGSVAYLDEPAANRLTGFLDADRPENNVGRRIGPYQIVREIGSGGMGSVYLAERVDEFQQKAALKLMRSGQDSRLVVSRFRHERQILAGLDHPNIARLLDGGATDEGRPFFLMEYVEGAPIDEYCRKHAVSVTQRLDLFRQVCSAVQYAHQRLVVHRDLKPGNILVGEDGIPKLLDFGIAKVLREDAPRQTALTQVGMRLMTPEYASPEQVRGLAITTASDVYSLGLILYELLTGRPPFEFKTRSPLELERFICETDPLRPSSFAPELKGDLDVIVLKALEKDPSRRYQSAEQLSEDIRRYREGAPIMARPHTMRYRTGKFVRRNRTAVVAAMLVLLSLTAGLIVAERERARAVRRFNDVRRLAGSFLFEFDEKIRDLSGAVEARKLLVARALEYLRGLAAEASGDVSLQHEVAEAYLKIGDVQGNPYIASLNDPAGALASYREALSIAQGTLRRNPRDLTAALYVARAHRGMAEILPTEGDSAGAIDHLKQAVALLETFGDEKALSEVASEYDMLGDASGDRAAYEKALALDRTLMAAHPDSADFQRAFAVQQMKVAGTKLDSGEVEAAIADYHAATGRLDALSRADPNNAKLRRLAATSRRNLGSALEAANQNAPALDAYRSAARELEAIMQADPANVQAKMDVALTLRTVGDLQYKLEDKRAALESYRGALAALAPAAEAAQANPVLRSRFGVLKTWVGDVAWDLHQPDGARLYADGLAVLKKLADRNGAGPGDINTYLEALIVCKIPQVQNFREAAAYGKRLVEIAGGEDPNALEQAARAIFMAGQSEEALALEHKAMAIFPEGPRRKRAQDLIEEFQGKSKK